MNIPLVYKEFESVEEFRKYFEESYSINLSNYRINRDYVWRRMKLKDGIQYIIYFSNSKNITNVISKSKIGFIDLYANSIYLYKEDNKIYTITTYNNKFTLENKLYHLIHGPKAISIPDAFKILAL